MELRALPDFARMFIPFYPRFPFHRSSPYAIIKPIIHRKEVSVMLFPLRGIRRIHREGFRCIPEAIRFRIALHRQRPFLQTETALRQA